MGVWVDRLAFVAALPFIAVLYVLYVLALIYWLVRRKNWDDFPFPI
jgi:hypothetical protein